MRMAQGKPCPCGTNTRECDDPFYGETFCYAKVDFWLLGQMIFSYLFELLNMIERHCLALGWVRVGSSSGPGPRARAGMGPVGGARGSPRGPVEPASPRSPRSPVRSSTVQYFVVLCSTK